MIHKLFDSSQKIIKQIALNFVKTDALKDIITLEIDNQNNIKNIEEIYVGSECECAF